MNKLAAEKIASEYYNIGVHLAMQNSGLVKEAGLPKEIIKKLVQLPTTGLSSLVAGAGAASLLNPLWKKVEHIQSLDALLGIAALAAGGGGALAGHHLAGKGVDLAHRGGSKAIDALKKLRT